jgi:ferredoxin-NADP reductase
MYKTLIIENIKEQANGVKLFYLKEKEGEKIHYQAGQYITFILPAGADEIRRSYSIASSPVLNEPLCIGVKRIENGAFSRRLVDYGKVGDELKTLGAAGLFTLPHDLQRYKQVFFFAAGSGIVPIFSLLKTVLHTAPAVQVVLIYSNRSPQDAIFYAELQQWQEAYPHQLKIEFLFSNSPHLFKAHLHAELIEHFLQTYCKGGFDTALYYLCGPEAYMRLCTYTLRALHVPAENIKKEIFHTLRSVQKIEPPDKGAHRVTVQMLSQKFILSVQYPTTILGAAKKAGYVLPYSCEVGRCGNCIARCTLGKVWMSYNEVLTEKEVAQGLLLTCTAYPVGGDATIEIQL